MDGGLAGGPEAICSSFEDKIGNFVSSEYCIYYNAAFNSALAYIHKIENDRKLLTNRISSIRYEIRRMVADIESVNQDVKQKMRLKFLFDSKKKIKDELENINYAKNPKRDVQLS